MNKCLIAMEEVEGKVQFELKDFEAPPPDLGDLEVKIHYSAINYKDALAVANKAKIIRSFPLIPGIDFCGEVLAADGGEFAVGDRILATGFGIGEKYNGGYTTQTRMSSKHALAMPKDMDYATAMALGTAGFTAMLCVQSIIDGDIEPQAGPIVVSGASGGVGGIAVKLLANRGYEVVAITSASGKDLAQQLGASRCLMREEMEADAKPLEEQKWAAAVDTVGGAILARMLAETKYGGVVAACGLAASSSLKTTVMPFILRGVRLQGVDSVYYPLNKRARIWQELATDFKSTEDLTSWLREIILEEIPEYAKKLLAGEIKGRIIVNLQP